ncbi:MAG: hypothetical protein CMJ72_09355 [Planctomycetaceae bacterium]|nr:hypothetical protein [Planctomycetaceae bacterium]HCK40227.1 hypothetical protein [Planctomycetaceae bacterium]
MTPRFNGSPAQTATWNALTVDFNQALDDALDSLEAVYPDVTFFRLDTAGTISDVVANPGDYRLANATDSAAPGFGPGDIFYNT